MTHEQAEQKAREVAFALTKKHGITCNCGAVAEVPGGYFVKAHSLNCVLTLQDDITAALLDSQKDAVKEVCEVLEPFAEITNFWSDNTPDDARIASSSPDGIRPSHVTLGHCRKAAALLNKLKKGMG
jgi:hypothetical protein